MNFLIFKFYYQTVLGYKWHFIFLFFMSGIWAISETLIPYLIKNLIEVFVSDHAGQTPNINAKIIFILSCFFIMETSIKLANLVWMRVMPAIKLQIQKKSLDQFFLQPLSFSLNYHNGELVNHFRNVAESFVNILSNILYGIFPVVISGMFLIYLITKISPFLSFFFLVWFITMSLLPFAFLKKHSYISKEFIEKQSISLGCVGDLIKNFMLVTNSSKSIRADSYIINSLRRERDSAFKLEKINFLIDLVRSFISLFLFCIICIGFLMSSRKSFVSVADFTFIALTFMYLRRSAWMASMNLLSVLKEMGTAFESIKILGIRSESEKKDNQSMGTHLISSSQNLTIKFEDVSFAYGTREIIDNLNLVIYPGEKILIEGLSGSGKTTLTYLMTGFVSPQKGKVTINEIPLDSIPSQDLAKFISYIPQNSPLLNRTVLENITFGIENLVGIDKVKEAAEAAGAIDFIESLDKGFETPIGENGMTLSGGQRQRIGLARLFLMDTAVIILDEATSALDERLEFQIIKNLLSQDNRTVICVSHNPALRNIFQKVIKMK